MNKHLARALLGLKAVVKISILLFSIRCIYAFGWALWFWPPGEIGGFWMIQITIGIILVFVGGAFGIFLLFAEGKNITRAAKLHETKWPKMWPLSSLKKKENNDGPTVF